MERDIFRLAYDVRMEAGSTDTAEVLLYGEIIKDTPKGWKWSQEDKSAADFDKEIKDVVKNGAKKLHLRINSPGGACAEAAAMRQIITSAGFDEVNISIEGLCASAATYVAALPGAHVTIGDGSLYMIHNPSGWAFGAAGTIESMAKHLRALEEMYQGAYAKRTGQTEDQIKAWMDAETWFTPKQAVECGFADEVAEAKVGAAKAVACITPRGMEVMRAMYKSIPEQIKVEELTQEGQGAPEPASHATNISNGLPKDGKPADTKPHKEEKNMDIKDIDLAQLTAGNPNLLKQIQDNAIAAERQRQEDIDALTMPGYEDMATKAKADGTSAMDFQRQIVAEMKKKGAAFIQSRQTETAPAASISGGAPQSPAVDEEKEIQAAAKDIAAFAVEYGGSSDASMY